MAMSARVWPIRPAERALLELEDIAGPLPLPPPWKRDAEGEQDCQGQASRASALERAQIYLVQATLRNDTSIEPHQVDGLALFALLTAEGVRSSTCQRPSGLGAARCCLTLGCCGGAPQGHARP